MGLSVPCAVLMMTVMHPYTSWENCVCGGKITPAHMSSSAEHTCQTTHGPSIWYTCTRLMDRAYRMSIAVFHRFRHQVPWGRGSLVLRLAARLSRCNAQAMSLHAYQPHTFGLETSLDHFSALGAS